MDERRKSREKTCKKREQGRGMVVEKFTKGKLQQLSPRRL